MTRLQAALRCSAAFVVLALIAAPVAFAPSLFDSASALAQTTTTKNGVTTTTVPDSTYGAGGAKESVSLPDYRLTKEAVRDSTGRVRENVDFGAGNQETRGFFDGQGRAVGTINLVQVNGTWQLTVIGFGPTGMDSSLETKTAATKEALENNSAYWQSQLRFWSTGAAGPVPAPGTPGYGRGDAGPSLPPGAAYAAGPGATQPGGITLQCANDPACASALAGTSGGATTLALAPGNAAAPSAPPSANDFTRTVTPDATFGPGGDSIAYGRGGGLNSRLIRDDDGDPRKSYIVAADGSEAWDFYGENGLSAPAGRIETTPISAGGGDLWQFTVYGPDKKTVIGGQSNLTRNDLDVSLSYWHGNLRSEAGGSARGAALRFTNGAVPDVGPPNGLLQFQPQPGGLTINCFGDAACERAQAASRGQFDYGKAKGDDGKDRPLYERPDLPRPELPRNRLDFKEVPRSR